jgi:uncharacterized metal-binding protein
LSLKESKDFTWDSTNCAGFGQIQFLNEDSTQIDELALSALYNILFIQWTKLNYFFL